MPMFERDWAAEEAARKAREAQAKASHERWIRRQYDREAAQRREQQGNND